ncbi:uncharacterized protein LOC129295030 [Prosopis cineraria]|uniref:uncharacterized protein LOC129295030 n=1 Tax=Prosopis cineraria TaxID=364024 RepID=UPI00240F0BF3|nr:uncharacterized protein LOC129295030 [Prosopis cineraria]
MENTNGLIRYDRQHGPAHYLIKIKSYSALAGLESYESHVFEASGYNWKMILYPHRKNEAKRDRHISLYLAIAKTEDLPAGWQVLVHFKFLVYDQIHDKYLVIEDEGKQLKRFHVAKTEWGFDELVPTDTLEDVANGYVVDDLCVFGTEIFVHEYSGNWECVSPAIKDPSFGTYTWKLTNFSKIGTEYCDSESFTVEGAKWKLRVHPNGSRTPKYEFLSIFLVFILLEELKDATNGYYRNDTLIIECHITKICEVEKFRK